MEKEPALPPRDGTKTGLERAAVIELVLNRSFHFGNLPWIKIFRASKPAGAFRVFASYQYTVRY